MTKTYFLLSASLFQIIPQKHHKSPPPPSPEVTKRLCKYQPLLKIHVFHRFGGFYLYIVSIVHSNTYTELSKLELKVYVKISILFDNF